MISTRQPTTLQKTLCAVILCAVLAIALLGTRPVSAQGDALSLSVKMGFDGNCKQNAWLPILVEIENSGQDLNGVIEATYIRGSGGQFTTQMEVELPATSRKEFFLYMFFTERYTQKVNVRLLDGKRVLKEVSQSANCLTDESMIFGVVADNASPYDALNDVKPLSGYVRVAQLTLSDLPDQAPAWDSLDALIVSNTDTGILSENQKNAMKSWVAAGGRLLIVGGFNWQGTAAGLKDFMPLEINSTRRVSSLSQLQTYVHSGDPLYSEALLAGGVLKEDAQVLVYQGGVPLLIQKQMGFGSVYFFAADPALQPLNGWAGMVDVYEHLLSPHIQPIPWSNGIQYNYQVNQALATIPELRLPSAFYIWCLLGVYIIIIGPLNYFVLRRFKRRELAWISIPLLVILFSSLAYGTGFFYRGRKPILNRLAVAQGWEGVDQAQVHGLVGIYSPVRTKYDLETSDHFVFQPFGVDGEMLQTNDEWTIIQQATGTLLPDMQGEIGAMKSVAVEGSIAALSFDQDLVVTITDTNPKLTGSVTNTSAFTLRDAMLVTSGNWKNLNDLAPGETNTINLDLGTRSNGPGFYGSNSAAILQLSDWELQNNEDAARRSAFLDVLLNSTGGVNRGNWGIYLMGWVDDMELPADLQNKRSRTMDTLLYVQQMSPVFKTEPGKLRLPTSMFIWESSLPEVSPYYAPQIRAEGYVLRFQPVVPVSSYSVSSIELNLFSNVVPQDLAVSAWDFNLKTWVHIPLDSLPVRIQEPKRYVGPDGEIRLQFKSRSNGWTEIRGSFLTVTVEP